MPSERDTLVSWLNDAHALEDQLCKSLDKQRTAANAPPELMQRIEQHLHETERHREMVAQCVESLGSSTSTTKDAMARISASLSDVFNKAAGDTVVKNTIMDYAMEHFEIASYRAIIQTARELNEQQVVQSCEQILADEERMADWLSDHLPDVIRQQLAGALPAEEKLHRDQLSRQ